MENRPNNGRLEVNLGVALAVIGQQQSVIRNFAERVYTDHTSSMRVQASIYPKELNATLCYAQACKEYLCEFLVRDR